MLVWLFPYLLLLWIAGSIGGSTLKLFQRTSFRLRPSEEILFSLALGQGIIAYGILFLGLLGGLSKAFLLGWLFILLLFSLPYQKEWIRTLREGLRGCLFLLGGSSWVERVGAGVALFLFFGTLLGALAPPAGFDWDGLSYHLAVPKVYLREGRIFYIPYDHHSNFPFTLQMLFTLGLAFGPPGLAKLFHWGFFPLSGGATLLLARRINPKAGFLIMALLSASPALIWESTVAYVELATMGYITLSVYAFLQGWREQSPFWFILSGITAGLAVGTKTFALLPAGVLAIVLLIMNLRRGKKPSKADGVIPSASQPLSPIRSLFLYLIPLGLISSPWFIKTWWWTGNPVYPFFYSFFGGRYWSKELALLYTQEQSEFGTGLSVASFLFLPWTLTFLSQWVVELWQEQNTFLARLFQGHFYPFAKGIAPYDLPGPIALGLLPLLIGRKLAQPTKALLGIFFGVILCWFPLSQQSRYLLPLLPLLIGACAEILYRNQERENQVAPSRAESSVLWVIVFLHLGLGTINAWQWIQPMGKVALGLESQEQYLYRRLDLYPAIRFLNQLPQEGKLLLFEETRGFYFNREYWWANPGHHTLFPYDRFHSAEEMVRWFRRRGFTYALINLRWIQRDWAKAHWAQLIQEAIREGFFQLIFTERGVQVYRLEERSSALDHPSSIKTRASSKDEFAQAEARDYQSSSSEGLPF